MSTYTYSDCGGTYLVDGETPVAVLYECATGRDWDRGELCETACPRCARTCEHDDSCDACANDDDGSPCTEPEDCTDTLAYAAELCAEGYVVWVGFAGDPMWQATVKPV